MTNPNKPYDTKPCLDPRHWFFTLVPRLIELIEMLLNFFIINLMTKPNKPYNATPRLDPSISALNPSA